MKRASVKILLTTLALIMACSPIATHAETPKEIKQAIIQQSLASYPGNCPCPYNTDRAGRSCGKRSAYSRAGGYIGAHP